MYIIALKMLIEDKIKYYGLISSLAFSALIIAQQASIFNGVMKRTYCTITDTPQVDIWVMDPNVKYIDDILPMRDTDLFRIRSIKGVAWAVPFFRGTIPARLANGQFQSCIVVGIDDSTLIGCPHTMIEGNIEDLRHPDAIIVNIIGARDKLAKYQGAGLPTIPLGIGEQIEINDRRATVVGICDTTRTFQSQPVIYTTYNRALSYAPRTRKELSFVLVKADDAIDPHELCKRINEQTGLAAFTKNEFKKITVNYYLKYTGIPINFGIAVLLGILIGAAISGLIFSNFISDNLRYLSLFSVMGASRWLLAKMTFLQAIWVGFLGWGIGCGTSACIALLARNSELSYNLSLAIFLGTGLIILSICTLALVMSIARIYRIELWTMFK